MFAKSALQSFDIESWKSPPALNESLLIKAANDITKVFIENEIIIPSKSTLSQIYKRLKLAFETKDIASLSRYDINHSPWVLFDNFEDEKPLIKRWRFWSFYKKLTSDTNNYRFVSAFYNAYLFSYPYKEKNITDIQAHIKRLFNENESRKIKRLAQEILNRDTLAHQAHKQINKQIAKSGKIELELKTRGLLDGASSSKFTLAVLDDYLQNFKSSIYMSPSTKQMDMITGLVNFAELEGELRYTEYRIEIANAILLASQNIQLQAVVKDSLKVFFLTHFGDPRVDLTGWHGVDDEARRVFQSWLVEKTMEDFFNLLSHVAETQSDSDRHWKYRKRFWNAFLKKGYIEEAWVALGPRAYEQAPNFIKGRNNYATLSGGDSKHSVLIMRIGELIITEWSHSGSYRVWHSEQLAPVFYKKHYNRDDVIIASDLTGSHHGNERGGWQERLSTHIRDLTGLKVASKDYMND
jgi:hypothetical protein